MQQFLRQASYMFAMLALITAFCNNLQAQDKVRDQLHFYADVMVNASDASNREYAGNKFGELFSDWVSDDAHFSDDLKDLPWVSVKYDAAQSFRIITWQIKGRSDHFIHEGYVQRKGMKPEKLVAAIVPDADSQYEVLDAGNWLGALYYGIEKVGDVYLLFGFHGGDGKEYTKLVDVLTFDNQGKAIFGKEIFRYDQNNTRPDLHSRIFVQYTPTASVSCQYDVDSKMIIHDYTSEKLLGLQGTAVGKVPDGTYVAFKFEDGLWQRIDKLENTPVDLKSPDYNKKRDKTQPDLFGRSKKGR